MEKFNKNSLGLSLGIIFAVVHILWFISIILGLGEQALSWVIGAHFIELDFAINDFNFLQGILTLIRAFIAGYIFGWILALIYNGINSWKKG